MTATTRHRDPLQLIGNVAAPSQWSDFAASTLTLRRPDEPPVVLPAGVTLDPAAAVTVREGRGMAPGRGFALGTVLAVGTLVWARHAGRWRHGVVDGEVGQTGHPGAATGKSTTVPVIYTADRTGRIDRHRWPVYELRLRVVTP